jgi:lipopolysaccharide/colanic/teichoic acid biosynthesis glycosyltransferase
MATDQGIRQNPADDSNLPTVLGPARNQLPSLALKRCLDLLLSLMLMAAALPILMLACVAIKLDSQGSVLYRQWRSGRNGQPFQILKLRTMVNGADRLGPALTQDADPRITRTGSALRRWSIDEIPQLLNVLAGQMSLVGPRPELVSIVAHYTPRQREILRARPGITGWAQVNGRDDLSIADKLELDLDYVTNRTTLRDLIILACTARVVLNGRGVKR